MTVEEIQNEARDFVTWYLKSIIPVLAKRCKKQDADCLYAEKYYDGYKQLFIDSLAYLLMIKVDEKFYKEAGVLTLHKFDKRTLVRISNKMNEFFEVHLLPDMEDDEKKKFFSLCVMRVSVTVYYAQREEIERTMADV